MDQWGPKHVKLTYVMNKTQSLKNFVYLVGLHIYYKMIHGPYNIKFQQDSSSSIKIRTRYPSNKVYSITHTWLRGTSCPTMQRKQYMRADSVMALGALQLPHSS